jgi:hypothetical protein
MSALTEEQQRDWEVVQRIRRPAALPLDLLIPNYLIHSYLYYEMAHSVITDYEYDKLAESIYDNWDRLDHPHKHVIDKESLKTSGFAIKYPLMVQGAARLIYKITI